MTVWTHGDELIVTAVTAVADDGPAEVARHRRTRPGSPAINDEHYPAGSRGKRTPKPVNAAEAAFLALGPGAASWLVEAAATGTRRIRHKMAEAVALAKLHGAADVDRALGTAAIACRFGENTNMADRLRVHLLSQCAQVVVQVPDPFPGLRIGHVFSRHPRLRWTGRSALPFGELDGTLEAVPQAREPTHEGHSTARQDPDGAWQHHGGQRISGHHGTG